MALSREELRQLAVEGARTRLQALETERRSLLQEFPELARDGRRRGRGRSEARGSSAAPATRRRNFTAAQRRAISKRMKALWAERRKAKKAA